MFKSERSGSFSSGQWSLRSSEASCSLVSLVSYNATEPNRPGPGRNMDRLFTFLGGRLEKRLNRVGTFFGLGPDACMERIQARLAAFPNPQSRRQFLILQSLRGRGRFFKNCSDLLKYAQ